MIDRERGDKREGERESERAREREREREGRRGERLLTQFRRQHIDLVHLEM